jgi:hypothetical protein
VDLISLVPGVAARPPGEDQGASVTVFGERSIANSFLIDGLDNNDPYTRSPSSYSRPLIDQVGTIQRPVETAYTDSGRASPRSWRSST